MDAISMPTPAAVTSWLQQWRGLGHVSCNAVTAFTGGVSNITCRAGLDRARVPAIVLRLERDRGIFEPYDVIREGRVLAALSNTDVPVPRLLASEPSPEPFGTPFIAMEWVDAPHMGEAGAEASFHAFAAMVARIHAVDWRSAKVDFLGVPASASAALERELETVTGRMQRFLPGGEPLLERAAAILFDTIPADGRTALCQGDINVFNYLFRAGEVAAVVDWEQARLSDPRSDVGQLVALSHLKGAPFGPPDASPFVQLYGAAAGEMPRHMAWFRARWLWELGVIYHGWLAFNGSSPWYDWDHLASLLQQSLAEI